MEAITIDVTRGDLVESRHRVHAVAVRDGRIVEAAGDPGFVTFMRSAAKPLQALPLALEHPELSGEELAIACASHEAREEQLAAVRALLARANGREDELECGPANGSRLRHNCSGKHAGMLLRTRAHGWPLPGYRLREHPLQRELLELVAGAAGLPPADVDTATDGCGVVTFGLPLWRMAHAFARLATGDLGGADAVLDAMRSRPELVGGPEANDSNVMRELTGAVGKRGAEGLLCLGLPDGAGVALKVEDGANRAVGPAAGRFLGVQTLVEAAVFNSRGERVGSVFPSS